MIGGIICEYNPFHNGHLFQLNETKKMGATHIIAVMSGNYVQRGELALIDKHKRAEIAIKCGADLVIELPVPYSVASAEFFAKGAIYILNQLGVVDILSFGSESGNIEKLKIAAKASKEIENSYELQMLISSGTSYPSAIQQVIEKKYDTSISEVFKSPNNTLAIEYIKALNYFNSKIIPVTVTRNSVSHDSTSESEDFASASLLRSKIKNGESIDKYVPNYCENTISELLNKKIFDIKNIEKTIFYKLMSMHKSEFDELPDASNGLSDRLFKTSRQAKSYKELLELTKTKCFTLARIRRVISYAILDIKKSDFEILPPYARILAFNDKGCEILSKIKKNSNFPISTSLAELSALNLNAQRFAELDEMASTLFSLSVSNNDYRKNEYSVKVVKI